MLNFKGGIKPDSHKYTKNIAIAEALPPKFVKIQLYNDQPCVEVGSNDLIGQTLTINNKAHSSICGEVISIDNDLITIKNNNETLLAPECIPYSKKLSDSTSKDIISFLKNKGIVLNGCSLYEQLIKASQKTKIIIVSCGETTPFVCSRNRILTESKKEIIYGTRIIMRALNALKAAITIESSDIKNKSEIRKLIKKNDNITLLTHTSKYPADNHDILKKQFKSKFSDQSITDENIFVIDCEFAVAIYNSFRTGLPMINSVVTVDGDYVISPKNILAPIGIPFKDILAICDTEIENVSELIINNPISGYKRSINDYLTKGISCILALSDNFTTHKKSECISCHKCMNVCPVRINPKEMLENNLESTNCIACGSCNYICPAKIDFSPIYSKSEDSYENK